MTWKLEGIYYDGDVIPLSKFHSCPRAGTAVRRVNIELPYRDWYIAFDDSNDIGEIAILYCPWCGLRLEAVEVEIATVKKT